MRKIWTIGHSTRTADEFIAVLRAHDIRLVADVRLLPGSRRYPHFNSEILADSLDRAGIAYRHFRELGGRRKPRVGSQNTGWRNEAFRGYADYMETDEFAHGIAQLTLAADEFERAAIMCAEAVWWRCHRGLIADYLKAGGSQVVHIFNSGKAEEHPFTSAAGLVNGKLSYGSQPSTTATTG